MGNVLFQPGNAPATRLRHAVWLLLVFLALSLQVRGQGSCPSSVVTSLNTASSLQLAAPSANNRIFVCAIYITILNGATPSVVSLFSAVGPGCGGAFTELATPDIAVPNLPQHFDRLQQTYLLANQNLCINSAAAVPIQIQLLYGQVSGTTISIGGNIQYPNGTSFQGSLRIVLNRATVTQHCTSPTQVVVFQPIVVRIVNGVLPALHLYPTSCLTPLQPYIVTATDNAGQVLFRANWSIENNPAGTIDVSQIH